MDTPNLTELAVEQLDALEGSLTAQFTLRQSQELTIEGVTELADLADAIDSVRAERARRVGLAERAEALAARVNAPLASAEEELDELAEIAVELGTEGAPVAVEAPAAPAAEVSAPETPETPGTPAPETETETEAAVPVTAETETEADPAAEAAPAPESDEGDTDPESEGAAPADQEESMSDQPLEPVTASADALSPAATAAAIGLPELPGDQRHATIVASADIPGFTAGSEFSDFSRVAEAFVARRQSFRGHSTSGDGDRVIVASINGAYPEERQLRSADGSGNDQKVKAVASQEAITASGGICAPAEPYYGLQVISEADRPVRAALAMFQADRGQIRFQPPPKISDLANAVALTTAAGDLADYVSNSGPTPNKPCLHVVCGTEQLATVQAIHRCLTFGNFGARTFPEQVEAWLQLSIAEHAREAEGALLDALTTCSTVVSGGPVYGAARTILSLLELTAAGYRSRHRMSANKQLRVLLPQWTLDVLRTDLLKSQFAIAEFWEVTEADVIRWFKARGLNVSWYMDSSSTGAQIFGAQAAGAILPYPSAVQAYMFIEGSFLFLDGGTLDLGLVRDSTLNSTNDYQIFAETFEAVACVGVEALKVNMTVCADGTAAPAAAAKVC